MKSKSYGKKILLEPLPSIQEQHKDVYVESNISPDFIFRPSLFLPL